MGRPSLYSEELADRICRAISTSNKGLVALCKENEGFPNPDTIYEWLKVKEGFSDKYTRAREEQADFLADEIIKIADDEAGDEVEFTGANHVNRDRLRIDARKWKASKLYPKKYGDKVDITTDGEKLPSATFQIGFSKNEETPD